MGNKIETKHHEPAVYELYDYLKNNHLGRENGIKKPELAQRLGISERKLRNLTKEINTSTELEKLVSTTHCCYMCNTREECEKSIRNTFRTAIALIKKGNTMAKKVGRNGQIKMRVGEDEFYEIINTFEKE